MRKQALIVLIILGIALLVVIVFFITRNLTTSQTLIQATESAISATRSPGPIPSPEPQNTLASPSQTGTSQPDPLDEKIDIGNAKLHIHCSGQGSPTVVLNAGPGDTWLTWQQVMPEVAKFTRVCAYDRAGLGQSTSGPKPRTSQQMADELAALLEKGNIPGPYVLVSHATSNWIDRLYIAQHRDQVAALVFVSPFHEDMISGTLAILASYPADLAATRAQIANQGEGQSVEDWLTSANQVHAAGSLGGLPLVLVAPGKMSLSNKPYAKQMDAMLAQQAQLLLALSTNSVRLVADQSGHFVQRDQPQAVVAAIRRAISK